MLTEYKTDNVHFFEDTQGRRQGEFKSWYGDGNMGSLCFHVDDMIHGERKVWRKDGTLKYHDFWVHGKFYRDLLVNPVDNKDKFLIALETGAKWLC